MSAVLEHILTTPLPLLYSPLIYLGFVAAGEEIEQLFGYNDNDPDPDMSCHNSIRQDICCLKKVLSNLAKDLTGLLNAVPGDLALRYHRQTYWGRYLLCRLLAFLLSRCFHVWHCYSMPSRKPLNTGTS
ncbi:hypothetical protein B0H14DRAFT_2649631 [Mycena olivaceomarginata]|nr:hypothetical protein B0H14DRAFT_2649631 [Mycena olivaceomarginata]